ncbi:hypothetical protein [Limnovirga soli]|uniref:Uncharacterized protein n=1 Tax=Limnovirga soli TaxID=2656915 RepID=A0A8J8FG88_9BACT|nr:hypothetical protein [Limnovirga soli]NNV54534.1 hypothetical protein [Limnovirga soli]
MANEQDIDLQKLSQRELLILVYTKVEALENTSKEQTNKQNSTDIELAILKTKLQVWSGIIGFCTGIISSVLVYVITKVMDK